MALFMKTITLPESETLISTDSKHVWKIENLGPNAVTVAGDPHAIGDVPCGRTVILTGGTLTANLNQAGGSATLAFETISSFPPVTQLVGPLQTSIGQTGIKLNYRVGNVGPDTSVTFINDGVETELSPGESVDLLKVEVLSVKVPSSSSRAVIFIELLSIDAE